jgi:plasmid stabilization system protein ParE
LAAVVFLPLAERDLANAFATINEHNPRAANEFRNAVIDAVDYLSRNPLAKPADDFNNRFWVLKRYGFSIVYELEGDRLLVIAIAAHRRDTYWR